MRFILVSEWTDGLGLCFTVECKECRVLWNTANQYYEVVPKKMCVCVVGNINEKPLGLMSGSLTKSSEQKNRNGVRQLCSALVTASSLIIVLYTEHGILEKPFSLEYLKSLNSSMYTARVSRERA